MDQGRIFGRGMSFPPRVGADGRVAWSEGEVNVRESIRIILMTEPRERIAEHALVVLHDRVAVRRLVAGRA